MNPAFANPPLPRTTSRVTESELNLLEIAVLLMPDSQLFPTATRYIFASSMPWLALRRHSRRDNLLVAIFRVSLIFILVVVLGYVQSYMVEALRAEDTPAKNRNRNPILLGPPFSDPSLSFGVLNKTRGPVSDFTGRLSTILCS
ncbi:hypothetical protein GGR58DRAFT_496329 [Xylaria digitata]|nr:hypothetical protein GGR58DRAFT_496329 [Xylaria digitata]